MKKFLNGLKENFPYIIYLLISLILIAMFIQLCFIGADGDNNGIDNNTYNAIIIDIVDEGNECEYVAVIGGGDYYSFTFDDFKLDTNKPFKLILNNNGTRTDKTDDIVIGFVYDNIDIYF